VLWFYYKDKQTCQPCCFIRAVTV